MKNNDVIEVAIVGLAVRLPGGVENTEGFWTLLRDGQCAIREFTKEELEGNGVPAHLLARPDYVRYAAPLDNFDHFDSDFFGLSPKEAVVMDPQHRQVLELSWEAMEQAGHVPSSFDGKVGVYAGCGMGSYFYFNVCSNPDLVDETGMFLLRHTGNDKDFLSTRVSHALDLRGPSINIQTACSTSLVAVHYAAEALRNGDCDMALAGGSTVELPQGHGYIFRENEILSPDGRCRAFDHRAKGTVFGSGAGVVALRRLDDAIRDGDPILAVLKGSAINNDGADKAGYLAPSVGGQAEAIRAAQKNAGVTADTIDYVECHGTGTYLGDPIEVAAMTEAFRQDTDKTDFCRIGSVKTNIGHLDTAAGVASLAKAALAIKHAQIPPSLGYEKPNPAIPFEGSPFRVNDTLTDWPTTDHPRRAAVNSLGVGGTNAHAIIEEAPEQPASEESDWPFQLLTISAKTDAALNANTDRLATYLETDQSEKLADIAFTLKEGRHGFEKRRVVVAESHEQAADLLRDNDPRRVFTQGVVADSPDIAFMFPGGGAQYAGMARDLYDTEPVFREWMDKGLDILQPKLDYDVRAIWLPDADGVAAAEERLKTPSVQLPLIMIVEYALAQLWMSWGVKPTALIGHSMGENTAACLAGVMSFEDCIGLVHLRGTLFDTVPAGGMLSVVLPEKDLRKHLTDELDIASINAASLTVATGPADALDRLEQSLKLKDIDCHRIAINIAAHSRMLDPILAAFGEYLSSIELKAPQIPFVSNFTGTRITDDEATSPAYWVNHLRNMVRFSDGIGVLAENTDRVFIEVGPGRAMVALAAQHERIQRNQVMGTLRDPGDAIPDDQYFVSALGRLWAMGGTFDWSQLWEGARRKRVALPTYAFQHKKYFIEPGSKAEQTAAAQDWLMRIEDPEKWGWEPFWKPTYADCNVDVMRDLGATEPQTWLVFMDETGLGKALVDRLEAAGHTAIKVQPGDTFARIGENEYIIAPELEGETYDSLLADLSARSLLPDRVLHLWMVTGKERARPGSSFYHRLQEQGFWSLFYLARGWTAVDGASLHVTVLTSDAQQVAREGLKYPEKSTVFGPAKVIPREFPEITVSVLDVPGGATVKAKSLVDPVLEEAFATPANTIAAWRDGKRLEQIWKPRRLARKTASDLPINDGAVILMTGGLGGIGLTLAEKLARDYNAKIGFVARSPLPPRDKWDEVLRTSSVTSAKARRIRGLMAVEDAGGEVMVLEADVSNPVEMQSAVDAMTGAWGTINGVLHAAGAIDDAPILSKDSLSIDTVLTAKVQGTQVLMEMFPDGALDWMVLFSSVSTVTAPAGQVDYVAANEYLNAVAQSRAGGETQVTAINWGVWAEVGMAAQAMADRTSESEPDKRAVKQPLFDTLHDGEGDANVFLSKWHTKDEWVLDEHRTRAGDALLPGTGYFELAAQALDALGHDATFEIIDLTFLRPLRAVDEGETTVRTTLTATSSGYEMTVESALDGQTFEMNAMAELRTLPMVPPARLVTKDIVTNTPRLVMAENGETLLAPQDAHLLFGPRWQVLKSMRFGDGQGLAELGVPQVEKGYHLHPGLLDISTGWAVELVEDYAPDQFWVPVSYGTARFFGQLPSQVKSWVRYDAENSGPGIARFDITLAAPDGEVCVVVDGFTIHRLEGDIAFAAAPSVSAKPLARPLAPAEQRLFHNIGQGIQPADGAAAFLAALSIRTPQVLISSLDLPGLMAQVAKDAEPKTRGGQTFERPDLDSAFVEPDGEIERRLAGFWSDLLGIEKIGADDNFFDLGGHSLIAVRLFAQVKSVFAVDFPISILFEAPTIRKCAALIAERGIVAEGEDRPEGAAPMKKPERRFTHIVPMQQGDGGKKTPFFLVAGMFGNVLNLRHLAHLVGTDRAVYGLQARGLLGGDKPHADLVEAARDYIAEMRQVQPKGPYMVGGFSGGGLTAYEIAQQLKDEGEDIATLIMLDTPLPRRQPLTQADKFHVHRLRLMEEGPRYFWDWAERRVRWEIQRRKAVQFERSTAEFHNKAIEAAFYQAISTYQVKPWSGPITLFRPKLDLRWEVRPGRWINSQRELVDEANYWRPYAENLKVHEVPGDHDSMVLEPNVRVLAKQMKNVIDSAEPDAEDELRAAE
ncbi:MAG: beta-ketoacyl synthase N-terminal-like domain-containing protein [Pseudomonadota bacterium]